MSYLHMAADEGSLQRDKQIIHEVIGISISLYIIFLNTDLIFEYY